MTCGSKKHIEEALAKIKIKNLEESQDQSKPKHDPKCVKIMDDCNLGG